MTLPATTRRAGPFSGNGATTAFPFTFKVFAKTDIAVVKTDTLGVETTLVLDADYSVALNADQTVSPGGTITYPISGTALAFGELLTAVGALPYDQPTDLPTGGAWRADTVENALDRCVMLLQQVLERVDRTVKFPPSDGTPANDALPTATARASKFLAFDADGNAIASVGSSGVPATAFMATVLDDTTAADARTTLGAAGSAALAASTGATLMGWIRTATGAVATTLAKWLDRSTPLAFDFMTDAQVDDVRAGTALVDVAVPLGLVLSTGLRGYELKAGVHKFSTGLTADYSAVGYALPGNLSSRYYIKGESIANTILNYAGAGYAITAQAAATGVGQGIHSLDALETFTLQDHAKAKTNSGILLANKAYTHIKEVSLEYFDVALEMKSCFTSKVSDVFIKNSNVGIRLSSSGVTLGPVNAISFQRVTLGGNSLLGVEGIEVGTCNSFRDCTVEQCGTQGNAATGGMFLNVGGAGYAGPLTLDNVYFESNAGGADLSIDNTTASHLTVVLRGCLFNRASNTAYTTNNIKISNSGGGSTTLLLGGNLFLSIGSYVADAGRPALNYDNKTEVVDLGGNYFNNSVDIQLPFHSGTNLSGTVDSTGAIGGAPAFLSAAKTGAGVYRITSTIALGKNSTFYEVFAFSTDAGGARIAQRVTKVSATVFDVVTSDGALTPADGAFAFMIVRKGGGG
jgi:hypothetical protein